MNLSSLTKRVSKLESAGPDAQAAAFQAKVDAWAKTVGEKPFDAAGARSLEDLLRMLRAEED